MLSESDDFSHSGTKNGPKTILVPLCPLILSKSFDFSHSGQKKRSKNYFCPTVSGNIVKKSRFCAQWDKKSSPKSTFVPLWTNSCDFALFKINLGFFGQKCSNFAPKNWNFGAKILATFGQVQKWREIIRKWRISGFVHFHSFEIQKLKFNMDPREKILMTGKASTILQWLEPW